MALCIHWCIESFFYAHCLSHFNYASTVWCQADAIHISKLQKLHRRGIRLMLRDCNISTDEKYRQLRILPLDDQFKFNACILMFKQAIGKAPSYIQNLFPNPRSQRTQNYRLPLPKMDIYKTSFSFWGASVWESLPLSCKLCNSLGTFKTALRRHFQSSVN